MFRVEVVTARKLGIGRMLSERMFHSYRDAIRGVGYLVTGMCKSGAVTVDKVEVYRRTYGVLFKTGPITGGYWLDYGGGLLTQVEEDRGSLPYPFDTEEEAEIAVAEHIKRQAKQGNSMALLGYTRYGWTIEHKDERIPKEEMPTEEMLLRWECRGDEN